MIRMSEFAVMSAVVAAAMSGLGVSMDHNEFILPSTAQPGSIQSGCRIDQTASMTIVIYICLQGL